MDEESELGGWVYGPAGSVVRSGLQRLVLFPILRFVTPIAVRGREAAADLQVPVIVAGNHVSHLDTPTILRALPAAIRRTLVVAAAKDYFYSNRVLGRLTSLSLATIPFDRGAGSRASLDLCERLLASGRSLLLFPEGTRSASGELGRVRHGVAVLAVEGRVPVLPVYVHGLADVLPKGTSAPLPGGVVVDIGTPLTPDVDESVDAFHGRVEDSLRRLAAGRPEWGKGGDPHDRRSLPDDAY